MKPCPHFPDCVGCAYIGKRYGEQLAMKGERVRAALSAYPSLGHLKVPPTVGSPRVFGYRNQAKLVARRARRGLLLGIYRPGTHRVVDIGECPVHQPAINRVLFELRAAAERHQVPAYDERHRRGWLRYVVVRASGWTKSVQVILVVRDREFGGERGFLKAVCGIRSVRSVVVNVNPSPGNVIFGDTFVPVTKETSLVERIGDLKLKSRAGAFLQANIGVARRIYDRVLQWGDPQPDEVAIDLYSGVGAISFYLASRAGRVFGIEESPLAVGDAKENVRLNGFHNVRFHTGNAGAVLAELRSRLDRLDLLTLNPPRKGADEATRFAIDAAAPGRIVYVSCNPDSLARDLNWFAAQGYRSSAVQPFDLLPQTDHVECVVLLTRTGEAGPSGEPRSDKNARAAGDVRRGRLSAQG